MTLSLPPLAVHLQERARKELASQVAEENRRIALAKSLERQQQRQAEAEANRQDMQQVRLSRQIVLGGGLRLFGPVSLWIARDSVGDCMHTCARL
jgi:hypothetical protein